MRDNGDVMFGDCFEIVMAFDPESIDMALIDMPYSLTDCEWDQSVNLVEFWNVIKRVMKDDAAIVLTASQPFTSMLVSSNYSMFKCEWIWEKSKASNFLQCKYYPMKAHENILVFCKTTPRYYPQKTIGKPYSGEKRAGKKGSITEVYRDVPNPQFRRGSKDGSRYPRTVQYFATAETEGKQLHPTQKPLSLFEYLIRTYSQEGDTVLDMYAGSGTTAIAAINTNRNYICIENSEKYYEIMQKRITKHVPPNNS